MALSVGTAAPDFSLAPAPGPDRVTLSEQRGKNVVLLFMPLAFSSTCTEEVCMIAEDFSAWQGLDAEVFGITIDSPFVTHTWREQHNLPFPILSDFNKDAITAFDVRYEEFFGMSGVGKRSAFVIDSHGVIRYAWSSEDAGVIPPFDEVKAALDGLA